MLACSGWRFQALTLRSRDRLQFPGGELLPPAAAPDLHLPGPGVRVTRFVARAAGRSQGASLLSRQRAGPARGWLPLAGRVEVTDLPNGEWRAPPDDHGRPARKP